ncbi:sigma factor-like helix-turn-helix DNA-binding protein [Streptomyces sp. NPDC059218]|uniref:sigma factor-like helix-turn-helix DNA-binding protein n=1 Tax=unclassified Streptomyces TaxID=2593676 RepID=UPI0036A676E0
MSAGVSVAVLAAGMEQEDIARGPEPEGSVRMARRRLGRGEMPAPLNGAEAARLGELFAEHDAGMRRYAVARLMSGGRDWDQAVTLAEDLVQQMWLEVARRYRPVLEPGLPDDAVRMRLCRYVKDGIWQHMQRQDERAQPVDFEDGVTCALVCALMVGEPTTCAAAGLPPLPDYLARMLDALPSAEREALLLLADGVPYPLAAQRAGCSKGQFETRVRRGLLLLQLDNPEFSQPPVAVEALTAEERAHLARLTPCQQEVVLRLTDRERRVVLLSLVARLNRDQIAARLGISASTVSLAAGACAAAVRQAA